MVSKGIAQRRSIRFYRDQPVADELISEVVSAGFCAPCAHGIRACHVVVVKDQQRRDKMAGIHKWSRFVSRAPVALVVCADNTGVDHFWIEDASAVMQNILTQATELGLATCWIGIRGVCQDGNDAEAIVREACDIPDDVHILAITPLGYAARHPGPRDLAAPTDKVHNDSYKDSRE